MSGPSYVAVVLHGHLPAIELQGDAVSDRLGERWLLEAIWECYLPLLAVVDRLAHDDVRCSLTISISPTLASMLRAPSLDGRLRAHLAALRELNDRVGRPSLAPEVSAPARAHYAERLEQAASGWQAIGGDLIGALSEHAARGRLELLTTSASHAYLPGLVSSPGAVAAQLGVGLRAFEALSGSRPRGLWLPECAFVPPLDAELARAAVHYTVLDGHALANAHPAPADGWWRPLGGPRQVAYFGRDRVASHQVWSRRLGYPGDPHYREFHRDIGSELRPAELGPLGVELPGGASLPTGLKYWRITGTSGPKQPYEPAAAAERASEHARHFVERCAARLADVRRHTAHPISVAAYDAELFGHWWLEGPSFLEHVLRRLAQHPDLEAISLGRYLQAHPPDTVGTPAASSWGEGGHGQVWVGPRTAYLWRHVHATHRRVRAAVVRCPDASGARQQALAQAVRESLLLQASDWAFMLHGGQLTRYAEERFARHLAAAHRLSDIAERRELSSAEARFVRRTAAEPTYLRQLDNDALLDAFCG